MKIKELIKNESFKLLNDEKYLDNEVSDVYIGDLLSWVMGNGHPDSIWLTVLNHMNIIAVASLREFKAIVLLEGSSVNKDVLKKADEEEIAIIATDLSAYEVSKYLVGLGL